MKVLVLGWYIYGCMVLWIFHRDWGHAELRMQWWWQWPVQWVISLSLQEICGLWSCILGKPRMMGCWAVTVTRKEICNSWSTMTCKRSGHVQGEMVLPRMAIHWLVWILQGCDSSWVRIFRRVTVSWSMKFPTAPVGLTTWLINTVKTEDKPECCTEALLIGER